MQPCKSPVDLYNSENQKRFDMQAIYHTSLDEITVSFVENLKKQFANAKVDIVIKDYDETDYLNSSETNKRHLDEAIKEVEGQKLIVKNIDEL